MEGTDSPDEALATALEFECITTAKQRRIAAKLGPECYAAEHATSTATTEAAAAAK
jgi:hypothetical protein